MQGWIITRRRWVFAQEAAVTVVKAYLCWLAGASFTRWPGLGTSQRYNDTAQQTYVTAATSPVLFSSSIPTCGVRVNGSIHPEYTALPETDSLSTVPPPNASFPHSGTVAGFKCSVGKKKLEELKQKQRRQHAQTIHKQKSRPAPNSHTLTHATHIGSRWRSL